MTNYTLSEPDACKAALEEYKEFNDPVRQFVEEILPKCAWDLLPFTFLYDLYRAWFGKCNPNGSLVGKNIFLKEFKNLVKDNPNWICKTHIADGKVKDDNIRPLNRMDEPEYLIEEYQLTDWMNPLYMGGCNDWKRR